MIYYSIWKTSVSGDLAYIQFEDTPKIASVVIDKEFTKSVEIIQNLINLSPIEFYLIIVYESN